MTSVVYFAKRSLISGHVINTEYSLDLAVDANGMTERVKAIRKVVSPIIEKNAETIRFGNIRSFDVQLAPLAGAPLLAVREFLDSCEEATFTFDPYGSIAVPVAPFSARLASDGYTLSRWMSLGQGGASDYFTVSFQVTEA